MEKKKGFKMPSAFAILFLIIIALAIVTWFIGGNVVPAKLSDVIMAAPRGMAGWSGTVNKVPAEVGGAIDVAFFVMCLGGFLGVVTKTGALDAGIARVVEKLKGKEILMIPVLMFVFSLGGTSYGMAEETIGFYPLVVATMMAAGFDALTGCSVIMIGAALGCLGSTINPFAIGVGIDTAQNAIQGMGGNLANFKINQSIILALGLILWISSYVVCTWYVMRYAKKVKANKAATLLSAEEIADSEKEYGKDENAEVLEYTGKRKLVMVIFAFTFIIMILSLIPWGSFGLDGLWTWTVHLNGLPFGEWYFQELQAWFFIMAVIVGLVYGLKEKEIIDGFMTGVADMISVALVVAVARGISVIMTQTGLQVYLLDAAANALSGVNSGLFASMSYIVYLGLSFLIPSTSGLATGSLGVFGPLAVKLGLSPEVMIMIFVAACGLVNFVTPTSGVVMGGLQTSRVEWTTWVKFTVKLLVMLLILNLIILSVAMMIL